MSTHAEWDTSAFLRSLGQKIARLKRNSDNEELRLAQVTADDMRGSVARDTGYTASTIHAQRAGRGAEVVIGGASLFLEFGTVDMSPRPFARPALAKARGRFVPPSWH